MGRRGDAEAMAMDENFLYALQYRMLPTVGIGIGINYLTILMANSASIQEVILFPQMRPEAKVQ